MPLPRLSPGVLLAVMKDASLSDAIVQVVGSKRIDSNSSDKKRFRLLLSDGKWQITYAMYTSESLNDNFIVNGDIEDFTIIKINRYLTSSIAPGNKIVLVLLSVSVLVSGKDVGKRLGDPKPLPYDISSITDQEYTIYPFDESAGSVNSGVAHTSTSPARNGTANTSIKASNNTMNTSTFSNNVQPINSITPYQNKWVIKARVSSKSAVRTWSNSKGEGKLFNFDVLDSTGEIRITGFRDAVDKYYDFIEVDKVYYISKCQVKMANKRFTSLKNDYEMTLNADSVVTECMEDDNSLPAMMFNFVPIANIAATDVNSLVDVIGVCKHVGDIQTIITKADRRELKKRDITLVDRSKASIALTLWGEEANSFNELNRIIAVRGARINEFGGGKTLNGGNIRVDPDLQESIELRGWYDNGGNNAESTSISARMGSGNMATEWKSFRHIRTENLGSSEKGDYFQVVGTILLVRPQNFLYVACSTEGCNKKLVDLENGRYRCEKCNVESFEFKYRLIGNMNVCDWGGNQWISVFNPDCQLICGATSTEIGEKNKEDNNYLPAFLAELNFKRFLFKCRVKTETYNDDTRLKTSAVKVEPINYRTYNQYLVKRITDIRSQL